MCEGGGVDIKHSVYMLPYGPVSGMIVSDRFGKLF